MISNKNYVILNNLSLLIDTSIEKINGSKILSLYDSSFLFGKLREFKTKYDVSEPVFCLRRPDLIDWYMECNMGVVLTKEFICSQDLVIYSNIPMIKNAREMLQQGFPERWESYILINETWKECKNNYSLLDTIPNIPLEDNITPLIYIYLKKEDKNEKFI